MSKIATPAGRVGLIQRQCTPPLSPRRGRILPQLVYMATSVGFSKVYREDWRWVDPNALWGEGI
jgi:hypothetical protein